MHAALQGLHLPSRDENRQLLTGGAPTLKPVLQRLAKFMWEEKLFKKAVPVDGLIEPRDLLTVQQ
jgi:hypothetical protein